MTRHRSAEHVTRQYVNITILPRFIPPPKDNLSVPRTRHVVKGREQVILSLISYFFVA